MLPGTATLVQIGFIRAATSVELFLFGVPVKVFIIPIARVHEELGKMRECADVRDHAVEAEISVLHQPIVDIEPSHLGIDMCA